MENYSHPDIADIIQKEGNSECIDCGSPSPKWASMNNGIFLCLKCAGVHRSFGMTYSLIRSLQIDSWSDNQLLFLSKGGNNNYKKNLSEFNIDPSSASVEIKYKSKAADYYRRYLKNEVDRESDSNYVPTQIIKPDLSVAQEIVEIKEETKEEAKNPETKEEKKVPKKFFGFMSSVLNKVGKGFSDMKLGEKFKTAGNAIAGAAKTSGHFIAEKTTQAVHSDFVQTISKKTKEGVNTIVQKTKTIIKKDNKPNENEESKKEISVKKEENEEKKEENKDENKEDNKEERKEVDNKEEKKEENKEEKKEEENKEEKKEVDNKEEKKEENKEEKKEENKEEDRAMEKDFPGNNKVEEERVEAVPEENLDS